MTEQDRPRFARLLIALSETFNEPLSEVRADVYFHTLSPFPVEGVERAAHALLRSSTFFPKPAEFVALLEGDAEDEGDLALARITEAVRRYGRYRSPVLEDRDGALMLAVWGSWERVCETLPARGTEEYQWERKRFLEMHKAIAHQRAREDVTLLTNGEAKALLGQIQATVKSMPTR